MSALGNEYWQSQLQAALKAYEVACKNVARQVNPDQLTLFDSVLRSS